ncbi:MAG: hypothetical protein PF961_08375 [Planctomycetota bacterium]|jgi:hypothetical protein|nr:hypothetical protein [Planctomycetota bacterium]
MRATLLRLERQQQESEELGLELLQRTYDELAEAVLGMAATRGYLGRDPLGAVTHLGGPDQEGVQLGSLVLELWRAFFDGFRPDEAQFEAARFRTAAGHIDEELQRLGPGEVPVSTLTVQMLETLVGLWEERQEALNQRLDMLIGELSEHQQRLGSSDLQRAYTEDELGQALGLIRGVLGELGEKPKPDDKIAALLARLVKRWRDELHARKHEADTVAAQQRDFLAALSAVAVGKSCDPSQLTKSGASVVRAIGDLVAANREQERMTRELERRCAELDARNRELSAELGARDQLINRYEFTQFSQDAEDQRLELYRQILAGQDRGNDMTALVEQVRELERVFVLPPSEINQALSLIDRLLDSLVKGLAELRRTMPLTEDPKRYRPRLLGSTPYKLKTLSGGMQASRDAARDVLAYIGRARWAFGVSLLGKEFPKLRKIFTEMVRLVGDTRDKLGGPPPASCTMNIGTDDGLAALPAVLATDLKSLMRIRGVARHAPEIAPLLEECVGLFHAALQRARGETVVRAEAPNRETNTKAIGRLAEELLDLAGLMEAVFAEAKSRSWQLLPEEQALLQLDSVLGLAVRDVDGMCDVLAVLRGAPATEFPKMPNARSATARRGDLDRLLAAAKARVTWLEDVARYRVEMA